MASFKIKGKSRDLEPLTWKEHRKLLQVIGAEFLTDPNLAKDLNGPDGKHIAEVMVDKYPKMVTDALAIGLRLTPEEVDALTLEELIDGAILVIQINKLPEILVKLGNVKGLLAGKNSQKPGVLKGLMKRVLSQS